VSSRGWVNREGLLVDAEAYARVVAELVGGGAANGTILDVGTGSGLPAAVVAARVPGPPAVWVERRRRRATFLRGVAATCGLASVTVLERDVRHLRRDEVPSPVTVVTAQAVAGWASLYRWTAQLHAAEVTMVARRGESWREEGTAFAETLAANVRIVHAEPLATGGTLLALRVPGGLPCR
jgi:16S rRNA (guanine527-N7)-methyltransferase